MKLLAMSVLDALDLKITPEALNKLGFIQRLYTRDIDSRYFLEKMSNEDKINMVNENIYYEHHIFDYYHIVVKYYPNSFSFKLYDCGFGKYGITEDLLHSNKNTLDDNLNRRQYNFSITCEGSRQTACAGQRVMCEDLRELESWLSLAKIIAKKDIEEKLEILND